MIGRIQLEKLIDVETLQHIQDSFAKAVKISAITVNYDGTPITKESNFTDFCKKIRKDKVLGEICCKCDAYGGIQAAINRKPHIYKCHAGLFDFAIPIEIQEQYVGSIMCGQIKLDDEDDDRLGTFGKMSKWDKNHELVKAYDEVQVKTYEEIEAAANLIYQVSKYMVDSEFISLIKEELNKKTTQLMKEENKSIELEKNLKESELKSLQYYINPNFIFNILNTISNLAYLEGAKKTEEFVYNFSDILRYTLVNDKSNTVIQDEINYIENYLRIQKTRFRERLKYTIEIDEDTYNISCPFMLLQPIVENAIHYVVEKKINGASINIHGYKEDNDFIIDISDNGDGISADKINYILGYEDKDQSTNSLNNINKKLIYTYGEEYSLKIYNNSIRKGTLVRVRLPIESEVVYV